MFNQTNVGDTLSDNNIASGNFSQNTLANFNVDFKGLEKSVGLFIPSVRNAMVERYRAETTYLILEKAIKIIKDNGLEIKAIPPKIALPLFDKLSIEHEEDMYEIWAKLLVSSSLNYDPISIYYADILSKIGSKEANLIKNIYEQQSFLGGGISSSSKCEYEIQKQKQDEFLKAVFEGLNNNTPFYMPYKQINLSNVPYPYYITGEQEFIGENLRYASADCFEKSQNILNQLNLLSQLNLIKYEYESINYINNTMAPKWGVVLTEFGYCLIRELQKYNIKEDNDV